MDNLSNIGVYGGGSWGSALACQAARKNKRVDLFLRDQNVISEILSDKTNTKYLGDIILPYNIFPSNSIEIFSEKDLIIIAVPSYAIINVIQKLHYIVKKDTILCIATKGLVGSPAMLLSDKIARIVQNPTCFIAGPNFAQEVAKGLLTPVTIAALDIKVAQIVADNLASKNFITSVTDDIITIQIAGAVKNIIAIQSGIYDAQGYGANAKAGLITEGLREIILLSRVLGGKMSSVVEYAVVGDLTLTCYSNISRNTKFGYELFKSNHKKDFIINYPLLVEGVEAAKLIKEMIQIYNLTLPLISSIISYLENPL